MNTRTKGSIIFLIILGGVIIGSILFKKKDIVIQIANDLEINLAGGVSVIEQQSKREYGENHLKAKLLIEKDKVGVVQAELEKRFGAGRIVVNKDLLPDFRNTCDWWDLDLEKEVTYYEKMVAGKRAKTIEVRAFILEEGDQYFLYLAY